MTVWLPFISAVLPDFCCIAAAVQQHRALPCSDVGQQEISCLHLDLDACFSEVLPQLQPTTVLNTIVLGRGV